MKRKLLYLATGLMSLNAMAVSLEFKFDINSSGPSMYACNAGIKHDTHPERICYDRGTGDSCKPADTCLQEEDCNCVCTGSTSGDGEHRMDFINLSSAYWTDNGIPAGQSTTKNLYAPSGHYNIAFDEHDREEWKRQITKMTVNLGSERYGAEFFLDVCYRGPQIEYWAAQNGYGSGDNFPSPYGTPNFNLLTQATITDIKKADGKKYSELANLQVKSEVVCDVQGLGVYKEAGPYYDEVKTDIKGMQYGDKSWSTPFTSFNTNQHQYLINNWVNYGKAETPRFCKIRYTFVEAKRFETGHENNGHHNNGGQHGNHYGYGHNNGNQAPKHSTLMTHLRKWKLQKAQVCTFTEINEVL